MRAIPTGPDRPHRAHPRLGHRRRRGRRRPVRHPARHLRRLHGVRPRLSFIEDYLRDAVLPLYANTHTESSGTGLQTTRFREEARRIIRDAVGGTDEHAVIFCGSGMTAAINKLVDVLNLRIPADLDDRYALRSHIPLDERPLVFIGPYEHHSNELPWRESIADVVTIREDADGRIDLARARARARGDRRPAGSGSARSRPRRT